MPEDCPGAGAEGELFPDPNNSLFGAAARKAVFWKEQSGFGFQINGLPDICGVISGRFYGFEVKRPLIGKLSLIQQARMESIRRAGGVCEVVSYVEDVKKVLAREGVLS